MPFPTKSKDLILREENVPIGGTIAVVFLLKYFLLVF